MSQATNSKRPARRGKRSVASARPAAARASAATAPAAGALPALPAQLDIRDAGTTVGLLKAAIAGGAECIDASRVASVDTAGLQLLLAAGRMAAAHGRALRWEGASSALIEAACKLGVAGVLGLARAG